MPLSRPSAKTSFEESNSIVIRRPCEADGAGIWRLVKAAGTLDVNSMYCNLLQCTHFAATCALAQRDGEKIGWVSGYIPPDHPERLFVWQVCVRSDARGRGLGKRLIRDILDRTVCADVTHIDTTITDDNAASWALFSKLARSLGTGFERVEHFEEEVHFGGRHPTEHLVSIGPFRLRPEMLKAA